jgi:hypothetical protein
MLAAMQRCERKGCNHEKHLTEDSIVPLACLLCVDGRLQAFYSPVDRCVVLICASCQTTIGCVGRPVGAAA